MSADRERERIFKRLPEDHRRLRVRIYEISEWIRGVSEMGMPRFGELRMQLEPFRETLAAHFADEELVVDCGQFDAGRIAAKKSELEEVHDRILRRLDALIECLRATDPAFCSWQEAVHEAESMMTVVREHENQELPTLLQAIPELPNESDTPR